MAQGVAGVFLFGFVVLLFSGMYDILKHVFFSSPMNERCVATVSRIGEQNKKGTKADVSLLIIKEGNEFTIPHFTYCIDEKHELKMGASVEVIWNSKTQKAIYADSLKGGVKKVLASFGCLAAFVLIAIIVGSLMD